MADELADKREFIRSILNDALDKTGDNYLYINNVQIYFGVSEVTLDLYYLGPTGVSATPSAKAQRLSRVVFPVAIAKEMAELVLNGILQWEDETGINLPLQRNIAPKDENR
jgi:hypothetical protein